MITDRDRILAKKIKDNIEIFDRLAFPDNPIEISIIEDCPKLEEDGNRHYLFYGRSGDKEKYVIFLDSLREELESWFRQDASISVTEDEEILMMAAHKVRHRLQYEPDTELFSKGNISSIGLGPEQLSERIYQLSEKEFDASIIQILIFQKLRSNAPKKNIIRQVLRIPSPSP